MGECVFAKTVRKSSVCLTQQRQPLDVGADVLHQNIGLLGDPSVVRHGGGLQGHMITQWGTSALCDITRSWFSETSDISNTFFLSFFLFNEKLILLCNVGTLKSKQDINLNQSVQHVQQIGPPSWEKTQVMWTGLPSHRYSQYSDFTHSAIMNLLSFAETGRVETGDKATSGSRLPV